MNAGTIEIIGPPGVGKTTLYEALCKAWRPEFQWIHQDELLSHRPSISDLRQWTVYQLRRGLKRKNGKSIPGTYGVRFAEKHQELAHLCWACLSYSKTFQSIDIALRFRSAHFLFMDFCRYQAVSEKECMKPCLINEGLLQKSFFVQNDRQMLHDALSRYVSLVPLPVAVIHVNTVDDKVILQRLLQRGKVIASHLGKDEEALLTDIKEWKYALNVIVEELKARNIPVYTIDSTRSVAENVTTFCQIFQEHPRAAEVAYT